MAIGVSGGVGGGVGVCRGGGAAEGAAEGGLPMVGRAGFFCVCVIIDIMC